VPDQKAFYGGQAVLEGVMMRAPDRWAVACRRADCSISLYVRAQPALATLWRWARWPVLRGNVALYESIALGWTSLQTSAAMAMEDAAPDHARRRSSGWMMAASGLGAFALAIGLFVLLPTWAVDWVASGREAGTVLRNVIEGAIRLAVIIAYIAGVGLMPDIRRVFQYHGAEHAAINCFEAGDTVTPDNVLKHSVLHPRCGTSFLLTVVAVKLVVNCFLGWPDPLLRALLRIAVLPLVAALAYEIIYFAGRHRDSLFARALAVPGMAMEALTTRGFDRDQAEVAIHALAAVAPAVSRPEGMEPARPWQPSVPVEGEEPVEELAGVAEDAPPPPGSPGPLTEPEEG